MSDVSTPYEAGGRARQKQRTRDSLVAAARLLVSGGATPTVEEVAETAGISRTGGAPRGFGCPLTASRSRRR